MYLKTFGLLMLNVTPQPNNIFGQVKTFFTDKGLDFGLNLLAALAIFVIGRWIAKAIIGFVKKLMKRGNVDETLVKFLVHLLYALLLAMIVLAALDRLGVDTTSFTAIVAAAGLAIGFALKDSLANFASGVMLIMFKPFKVGDFVDAGGSSGVIEEIRIFNTFMRTGDNVQIIIPNSQITGGTITNYSAKDTRRIDLVVGCGYGDDLKEVKNFLTQLVAGDERILDDPAPVIAVDELANSSINFVVRPWVKSADYWTTRWDLTEKIKLGFDERGFTIPFPSQDLFIHKSDE